MYFLDITTLLHILQTHAHTGFLRAHLPKGVTAIPEARIATVTVVKGDVTACAIFTPDGSLVETGDTAYTMLATRAASIGRSPCNSPRRCSHRHPRERAGRGER